MNTTDSGITSRGKWIFRTSPSRSTTLATEPPVDSEKNVNITMPPIQRLSTRL